MKVAAGLMNLSAESLRSKAARAAKLKKEQSRPSIAAICKTEWEIDEGRRRLLLLKRTLAPIPLLSLRNKNWYFGLS